MLAGFWISISSIAILETVGPEAHVTRPREVFTSSPWSIYWWCWPWWQLGWRRHPGLGHFRHCSQSRRRVWKARLCSVAPSTHDTPLLLPQDRDIGISRPDFDFSRPFMIVTSRLRLGLSLTSCTSWPHHCEPSIVSRWFMWASPWLWSPPQCLRQSRRKPQRPNESEQIQVRNLNRAAFLTLLTNSLIPKSFLLVS